MAAQGAPHSAAASGATQLCRCRTEVGGTTYTLNIIDCSSLAEAARLFNLSNVDAFVVCLSDDRAAESVAFAQRFDAREHAASADTVVVAAHLKSDRDGARGAATAPAAVDRAARACVVHGAYVAHCTARDVASPRRLFAQTLGCVFAARRPCPAACTTPSPLAPSPRLEVAPTLVVDAPACTTEYTFKVVVIGEVGTGKTALVKRLVHGAAPAAYRPTVGVDFDVTEYRVDAWTTARVQLWDVSGQERFGSMTSLYYRQCMGALVVCDQARAATFFALEPWLDSFRAACRADVPAVMAANKCDLRAAVPAAELERFSAQNRLAGCVDTCALTGRGCSDALRLLVTAMVAYARTHGIEGTRTPIARPAAPVAKPRQQQSAEGPVLFTSWRF